MAPALAASRPRDPLQNKRQGQKAAGLADVPGPARFRSKLAWREFQPNDLQSHLLTVMPVFWTICGSCAVTNCSLF